jgi:hypothetical protein
VKQTKHTLEVGHLSSAKQRMCQLQSQINDCLHILEDCRIDAVKMIKVAKKIKELRQERRYWKELVILHDKLGNNGVKQLISWFDNKEDRKNKYIKESQKSLNKLIGEI